MSAVVGAVPGVAVEGEVADERVAIVLAVGYALGMLAFPLYLMFGRAPLPGMTDEPTTEDPSPRPVLAED